MPLTRCVLTILCIFLISCATGCRKEEKGKTPLKTITASEVRSGEPEAFARAFIKVQSALEESGEESGSRTYGRTTAIVKREGLTVERYTQLAGLMNKDADFKKKVEEEMRKIREKGNEHESRSAGGQRKPHTE